MRKETRGWDMTIGPLLSETYFGSTVLQYLTFFAVVAVGAVIGRSLSFFYKRRLRQKAEATETELDDIILRSLGGPVVLLGVIFGVVAGRRFLTPVEPLTTVLSISIEVPVVIAIAWISIRLTDGFIETYIMEYVEQTESKLDDELVPIVSRITNIAIVSIAGIVILDSVGYDVTAVIASLGVGGIAVAFASRKTMADVFGGAHILATKPFVVEDIVDINGTAGTVEEIGLRTTRIRDFDGRTITVPNSTIANAEVKNITSEPTRRVETSIGLSYQTSPGEMETALELARETVNGVDGVDTEQTGAWFWEYDDAALRILIHYYVRSDASWREVKDRVNRGLQDAFETAEIELAPPVGTVQLDAEQS